MANKTAFVAGATGFIGSYLLRELLAQGYTVNAILHKKPTEEWLKTAPAANVFVVPNGDIGKANLPKTPCDVFFDLAWQGVAGNARANHKVQLGNVQRSLDWMQKAALLGCKKFIGASSISEMECALILSQNGQVGSGRYVYSTAKLASNYMHKCLGNIWGIQYINACIGNAFGPGGLKQLIVHDTIIKLLNGKKTAFSPATQMYDFVYVSDIAKALVLLAEKGKPWFSYYIGSGEARPLKDFIVDIKDIVCPSASLGFGVYPEDTTSLPKELFSIAPLVKDTGFCPQVGFAQGIKKTLLWQQNKAF